MSLSVPLSVDQRQLLGQRKDLRNPTSVGRQRNAPKANRKKEKGNLEIDQRGLGDGSVGKASADQPGDLSLMLRAHIKESGLAICARTPVLGGRDSGVTIQPVSLPS